MEMVVSKFYIKIYPQIQQNLRATSRQFRPEISLVVGPILERNLSLAYKTDPKDTDLVALSAVTTYAIAKKTFEGREIDYSAIEHLLPNDFIIPRILLRPGETIITNAQALTRWEIRFFVSMPRTYYGDVLLELNAIQERSREQALNEVQTLIYVITLNGYPEFLQLPWSTAVDMVINRMKGISNDLIETGLEMTKSLKNVVVSNFRNFQSL